MKPIKIDGADEELHAPVGMPSCDKLWVRFEPYGNGNMYMTSAWQPSAGEIRRIVAGAPIRLTIISSGHPPVKLEA